MEKNNLEAYKLMLINTYKYEYDNNQKKLDERYKLLNSNYSDEYLMEVLKGTYQFSKLIISYLKNKKKEYIKIPLECEPEINYIDLNLIGGWKSDTIVHDSNNNLYSMSLLNKIFGNSLLIEPCRVEYFDKVIDYDDSSIISQTEKYFFYVQKKEVKLEYNNIKRILK